MVSTGARWRLSFSDVLTLEVPERHPGDRGLSRRYEIGEESLGVTEVNEKELGKYR